MPLPPRPSLLDDTLRIVVRRYLVPTTPEAALASASTARSHHCTSTLAVAIDQARRALAHAETPPALVKQTFVDALAQLIGEAMRENQGDPAIQAMVLRHQAVQVREYASLAAGAESDRREVVAAVNAIAHPAKLQRLPPGPQREVLGALQAAASAPAWAALSKAVQPIDALPEAASDSPTSRSLARLRNSPALERLCRLDALASDALVQRYQALWSRNGPRSGTPGAVAQGLAAQQRGADVEAQAATALEALAHRLNTEGPQGTTLGPSTAAYRVVTSMHVPPELPGSADRAKSEWDAALLRRASPPDAEPVWDVCLLVEAKASVDAASTDFPRLLRGMQRLAQADAGVIDPFLSRQGTVTLRGASLSTLPTHGSDLAGAVLYCCDAPADTPVDDSPRLLNAACRMQLLSAPASVAYASQLALRQPADAQMLEAVWQGLLASPQWAGVLNQYPLLHQVRALMVHTDDLFAATQHASL
ncbi:3-deoxy-D-arabino-heptulosonate 7-phosphate synthase [Achromobacter sp. MY14]|uniref:3-deoxy-D-arabino-heptulosonate 7-phosphate synthase n=1 Tax=unclassified Achromobacter TaxID=2626865 RepID=UPI001E418DC3|nr:3-deoxy-D-arabino-heptulosonate 7-phosphate synthase [Achromobacter sp. MY14]MCD0501121.1 3-deoxy-D-arabino-heptulosonate 7-phosphate synthase [Achromobacter sp. MY14]